MPWQSVSWEVPRGLDALTYNGPPSPSWDADGDGLGLFDEYRYCTDISKRDTDGDGVSDGDEVPHSPGSCPNDADDAGNPTNCVTLSLTVGDPSGSSSERWTLDVFDSSSGRQIVRHCDDDFGMPGSAQYALVKGKTYTFKLSWVATDPEYDGTPKPDYDWRCLINGSNGVGVCAGLYSTGAFIVEDPGRLLTEETQGNAVNITIGKAGKIIVPKIVTETVATSPSDRTRKTVGVGEEVTLTLLPEGLSGVLWNMTEGSGQISGYTGDTITFTAPDRATNTTITVDTDAGTVGSVTFHVIQPQVMLFENMSGPFGASFPNQSFFQVSYGADVYFQPDSVNFYNIAVCESEAITQASPGYFQDHPIEPHASWEDSPRSLSPGTVWVVGKGTRGNWEQGDTIGGYVTEQPFTDGYAYWDITWSYKVGSGLLEPITVVRQDYRLIVSIAGGNTNTTFRVTKGASGAEISSGEQQPHFINP